MARTAPRCSSACCAWRRRTWSSSELEALRCTQNASVVAGQLNPTEHKSLWSDNPSKRSRINVEALPGVPRAPLKRRLGKFSGSARCGCPSPRRCPQESVSSDRDQSKSTVACLSSRRADSLGSRVRRIGTQAAGMGSTTPGNLIVAVVENSMRLHLVNVRDGASLAASTAPQPNARNAAVKIAVLMVAS